MLQLETRIFNETKFAEFCEFFSQRRKWFFACIAADVFANLNWKILTQHITLWIYRMLFQIVRTSDIHDLSLEIILFQINDRKFQHIEFALCFDILCNWSILLWIGNQKGRFAIQFFFILIVCLSFFNMLVRVHTILIIRDRNWKKSKIGENLKRQWSH